MYWNTSGYFPLDFLFEININMRCIEIRYCANDDLILDKININMRCIEILTYGFFLNDTYWLTLTWDVLKCF